MAKMIKAKFTVPKEEQSNKEIFRGRLTTYEFKEAEKDLVHVELEKMNFDSATGKKKSNPFVQMYDVKAWSNFRKNALKLGFTHVRVLHAPEGVDTSIADPKKDEKKAVKK